MTGTPCPRTVSGDHDDDADSRATLGRIDHLDGGGNRDGDDLEFENDISGEKDGEAGDGDGTVDRGDVAPLDDLFMASNPPLTFVRTERRRQQRLGMSGCGVVRRRSSTCTYESRSSASLRNSLLPLAGFLELANAGDFAANVFNTIPVPTFAAALMGVGGVMALSMSAVAVWDARLSWRNVVVLREERKRLLEVAASAASAATAAGQDGQDETDQQEEGRPDGSHDPVRQDDDDDDEKTCQDEERDHHHHHHHDGDVCQDHKDERSSIQVSGRQTPTQAIPNRPRALQTYLDVNRFELRTEILDRLAMDVTMGFGAVLVGVGTLMAIAGADPKIFLASNLLSGYVGNGPGAVYGLVRAGWSAYVWRRVTAHERLLKRKTSSSESKDEDDDPFTGLSASVSRRYRRIKLYAALAGPTSLVAGAASMITATRWWGYVLLLPCILVSLFCNWFFRREIGYQRPLFVLQEDGENEGDKGVLDLMSYRALVRELQDTVALRRDLEASESDVEKAAAATETIARTPAARRGEDDDGETRTEGEDEDDHVTRAAVARLVSPTLNRLLKLDLFEPFYLRLLRSGGHADEVRTVVGGGGTKAKPNRPSDRAGTAAGDALITIDDPAGALVEMISTGPFGEPGFQDGMVDKDHTAGRPTVDRVLSTAQACLASRGGRHARYRERYLVEFLGCWLHHEDR